MRNATGQLHYYLNDHLGSSRVVIDTVGNIKDYYKYYAYGNPKEWSLSTNQPNRYTGKPYDEEKSIDLYYYGKRYFDGERGIFTQIDPVRELYSAWSPYVYTLDNPYKHVDPDGRNPLLVAALGGAVAGGAVGGAVEFLSQKSGGHIFEPSQYDMSRPVDWGKVGDATVQWASVGAITALTGPSGLGVGLGGQMLAAGTTSAAIGSAIRESNGQTQTVNDVAADALGGAVAPLAGEVAGQIVNKGVSQAAAKAVAAAGGGKAAQQAVKKAIRGVTEDALNQVAEEVIEKITSPDEPVKQP